MQAVTGLQNSAHIKIFNSGLDDSQHKCIRPSFFLSQGTIRSENCSARSPFKISLQTPKLYILRGLSAITSVNSWNEKSLSHVITSGNSWNG